MRFVIRNNHDVDGITEEMIGLIDRRYGIEYGAVFDYGDVSRGRRDDIEYFSYKYCTANPIRIEKDVLSTPVPRDILDGMLKYKSMILSMVSRETHYNIYRLDYLEKYYYERLRFWYGFLTAHKIDLVLFMIPPHHAGEYMLYSLCELMSIKKVVMIGVMPGGVSIPVCRINEVGSHIIRKMNDPEQGVCELNETFKSYEERVKSGRTYSPEEIRDIRKVVHAVLYNYVNARKVLTAIRRLFLIPILPRYRDTREYEAFENKRYLSMVSAIRREERHRDHIRDYNRLAVTPDLSRKFIYFPLQQEPEDTTMPRAGEFKNQILSLLILSAAAGKYGLTVYVKEHWVQEHREKGYYKRLASIDNVELVDITYSSSELIRNSVAVSSQTGSSIIEALMWGKNSLIFGEGCPYIGCPGSFYIGSVQDVTDAIDSIMANGCGFSESDKDRYMIAYQNSCIDTYCDSLDELSPTYDMKNSAARIVESIDSVAGYNGGN